MPCEHYKDALIEAAASGAAPQDELRAHLVGCPSCWAAFAEGQTLFAAIDSGLHAAVSAEVPPSLLPRVRASLDAAIVRDRRWLIAWPALSAAVVVAGFLFAVNVFHYPNGGNSAEGPIASASSTSQPTQVPPNVASSAPPKPADESSPLKLSGTKRGVPQEALVSRSSMPEVLVPKDQELLIASYARQWSTQKRAPLVQEDVNQATVTPLEVAPIQITQLDVKLLKEDGSI